MKIHTVELWPGAPELHEVVLHSEHIQALARVEAAARENLADERRATSFAHNLLAMAKSERDKAYSQLAKALKLLGWSKYQLMLWEDYQVENGFEVEDHYVTGKVREEVEAFLARHAQAEQQEAQQCPDCKGTGKPIDPVEHGDDHGYCESCGATGRAEQEFQGTQSGDERAAFERHSAFVGMDFGRDEKHPEYYASPFANGAWEGWQARATLAAPPAAIKLPDRKRTDHLPAKYKTMTPTRASIESYNRALDDVTALNAVRGAEHE